MRLWQRSHSRFNSALRLLAPRDRARRAILERSVRSPFTAEDVAGALLGEDLWFEPLRDYRAYLQTIDRRPHLWGFSLEPSGRWEDNAWQSLSLSTRVARARLGSLVQGCEFVFAPSTVGLAREELLSSIVELRESNLCHTVAGGVYYIEPLASTQALQHDICLIRIISHWLGMLAHADIVAKDRRPSGYEVGGYEEACPACEQSWGIRPRSAEWIPPFHPGCRCFAQPRFAQ